MKILNNLSISHSQFLQSVPESSSKQRIVMLALVALALIATAIFYISKNCAYFKDKKVDKEEKKSAVAPTETTQKVSEMAQSGHSPLFDKTDKTEETQPPEETLSVPAEAKVDQQAEEKLYEQESSQREPVENPTELEAQKQRELDHKEHPETIADQPPTLTEALPDHEVEGESPQPDAPQLQPFQNLEELEAHFEIELYNENVFAEIYEQPILGMEEYKQSQLDRENHLRSKEHPPLPPVTMEEFIELKMKRETMNDKIYLEQRWLKMM